MKQALLGLVLILFVVNSNANNNYLVIKDPTNYGYYGNSGGGNITNASIEVTPHGIYAQVDMTLTLALPTGYSNNQLMEAVLFFDLPAGSYMHDSWLWLNDTTIIHADIVERDKAIRAYTGIVHRSRDPSLLINTLPNSYQLNVYPLSNNYARKVKLTYSTPFVWRNGKAVLQLPTNILGTAVDNPDFILKVNASTALNQPAFINSTFSNFLVSQAGNTYNLQIPAASYRSSNYVLSNFLLTYTPAATGPMMYTYQTSQNEGVFQFVVPPATPNTATRNVVFILDQYGSGNPNYYMHYSVGDMLGAVKTSLLMNLRPTDSFNIFYANGTSIVQTGSSWRAADTVNINAAIGSISPNVMSGYGAFRDLLRNALSFSQSKPGAQAILWGSNAGYQLTTTADTFFTSLNNYLGGFTNRIDVINNSPQASPSLYYGPNEYLYNKLCSATGGNQYKNYGSFYDGYAGHTYVDQDADAILQQIILASPNASSSYNVVFPINGITYSESTIGSTGKYDPANYFMQVGRYYGTWTSTGNLLVKYVTQQGLQTSNSVFSGISTGDNSTYKSWLYNYMKQLKEMSASNKPEILDSCLKNRLLFDYTAFLAIETGDTLHQSVNNALSVSSPALHNDRVNAFPNPFTNSISIKSEVTIIKLQVYDILGRFIWESIPNKADVTWGGISSSGALVDAGIYLLVVTDKNGNQYRLKVQKQ